MAADCLFCRIVRHEIPAAIVAETEDCVAFRDINPQAPVHVLIVPREHVVSLNDVSEAGIVGRMAMLAADIAGRENVSVSGYRVAINTNAHGGQSVFHLHMHLLGGRQLAWPPG